MRTRLMLLPLVALIAVAPSRAATETFDLAAAGAEEKRSVPPGTVVEGIEIVNRLPGPIYNTSIELVTFEEDPLSSEFFSYAGQPLRSPTPGGDENDRSLFEVKRIDLCAEVHAKLAAATDESTVARIRASEAGPLEARAAAFARERDQAEIDLAVAQKKLDRLKALSEAIPESEQHQAEGDVEFAKSDLVNASMNAGQDSADCFAATRSLENREFTIAANQQLVITIERALPSPKKWVRTLTTGQIGKWYTTYGFTFFPDRNHSFFAKQETSTPPGGAEAVTVFRITEEKDRNELEFRPSILFHYQLPQAHNHSLVAGLGYDLENIALFAGYGYSFHSNVTLTAGLAIHEQEDLIGRYEVGDTVKEAIDSAQLVSKTFAPNLYLGVSFRFGTNIFAERDAVAKKVATERANAAEAKLMEAKKKEACLQKIEAARVTRTVACDAAQPAVATDCSTLEGDEKAGCETEQAAAKAKTKEDCLKVAEADAAAGKAACAADPDSANPPAKEGEGASPPAADSPGTEVPAARARSFAPTVLVPGSQDPAAGARSLPRAAVDTPAQDRCIRKAELGRAEDDLKCLKDYPATANSEPLLRDKLAACKKVALKKEAAAKADCQLVVEAAGRPPVR